ncbi:hypothetical protein [Hoeflea sp. TYP-13]|uniref:hypothetical protein n=1 Tax=Hoeflea sp. TYP-13 TaxID=3230023 RepID=UPI0034C66F3E
MLIVTGAFFAVFFANVVAGAVLGTSFLNDISEMLFLLAASISFVVAILTREQQEQNKTH